MDLHPKPRRLLWCDAEANCHRMATREGVRDVVTKAARAGVDTLIVDVKPLGGEVLYDSRLAPRLGEVDGKAYPEGFDLLRAAVEEGHAHGLLVHAAINVFSEGHRGWERGPAYAHADWQTVMYEVVRTAHFTGGNSLVVEWVNPWSSKDSTVAYTRRSGAVRESEPDRVLFVVDGDTVTRVVETPSTQVEVPAQGCVLSVPIAAAVEVSAGDRVSWTAERVPRLAQDSRTPSWGVFVNPIGPARQHELAVVSEIVSGYDIDGIVFDRMRYPGLFADFSEISRASFEEWLGRGTVKWPDDILTISPEPWGTPTEGRYYREWLMWRALQIREFAGEAVDLVRSTKPGMTCGVYVGSWYESYYDVGVNWGSRDFRAGYPWMLPEYHETGYAELFDYICTGCYYPLVSRGEARDAGRAEGATVEAACEISRKAIGTVTPVYGSLYLRDYAEKADAFRRACEMAMARTDGVMLFDLVYLEDYGWWPVVERLVDRP